VLREDRAFVLIGKSHPEVGDSWATVSGGRVHPLRPTSHETRHVPTIRPSTPAKASTTPGVTTWRIRSRHATLRLNGVVALGLPAGVLPRNLSYYGATVRSWP
jgi:hypothetical protein